MIADALLASLQIYHGIHGVVVGCDIFVLGLTIILVASLYHASVPSRGSLFWTGWFLLLIGCATVFGLAKLSDSTHTLTTKLTERSAMPDGQNIEPNQSLTQQESSVEQTIQIFAVIVPLVSGGLGVNLIVAGVSVPKTRKFATDDL